MSVIDHPRLILALKRALQETFDKDKWLELSYITDCAAEIEGHPRLLRSLGWGDEDYPSHILWALNTMRQKNSKNLQAIIDYIKTQDVLREKCPELYAEIFGVEVVSLQTIKKSAKILNVEELDRHLRRIQQSVAGDPEQAIGSAKELLETVFKTVLEKHGQKAGSEDLGDLWRLVLKKLTPFEGESSKRIEGADSYKRIISSFSQIILSVAEIRNLYGTGHGKSKGREASPEEARLVVNAANTIATFILELSQGRKTSNDN